MWEAICKSHPNGVGMEFMATNIKSGVEALMASPELVLARIQVPERATMVVQLREIQISGFTASVCILTVSAEGRDALSLLMLAESEVKPAITIANQAVKADTTT